MKNFSKLLMMLAAVLTSMTAAAIPVMPGQWKMLTLSDGTTVRAEARGSEFGSWWEDAQGQCYVVQQGCYVKTDRETLFSNIQQNAAAQRARVPLKAKGTYTFDGMGYPGRNTLGAMPSNGEWDIPVLMVEFSDLQFKEQHTEELFNDYLIKEGFHYSMDARSCGSIRDYFVAQSQGQFKPNFKLLGKVKLDKSYAYYGANDPNSPPYIDIHCRELPGDAMRAAKAQLGTDFTTFSAPAPDAWHVDGIPLICIIYAGEAESNVIDQPDLIWPHELDLSNGAGIDIEGVGVHLNSYFVGNELLVLKKDDGTSDERLAGIGVFCHELGHALGLPDWYCTNGSYEGDRAFSLWSVMDIGCYEGGLWAPVGYTAYDRSFMGWLQIPSATEKGSLTLTSPQGNLPAVAITNPTDKREYFILESRQPSTWYADYLGSGLMLTRYAFNSFYWGGQDNPNNVQNRKRAQVVTADKSILKDSIFNSNLFGNGVNTISGQTFWSGDELTATISNIKVHADGSITLDFDPGAANQDPYFTRQVPVNRGGQDGGLVTLRFYEDMPSVPYISAADFQTLMLPGTTITVTKNDEGLYTLKNPFAEATVNTTTEQFTSDDYMAFTNLMGQIQEGMDNNYLDGAPFVRYRRQELSPASATVTFDFKKYGIDLRGDDEAVYFPLATIADLYSDLYYHIAGYNGEKVIVVNDNDNAEICKLESQRSIELILQTLRADDMAAFCYKELCFTVDHFYGMPGRSPYEQVIKEYGLDKALSDNLIADGADIKKLLTSTSMKEYIFGMSCLQAVLEDGGHTVLYVDYRIHRALAPSGQIATQLWLSGIEAMKNKYPSLYTKVWQCLTEELDFSKEKALARARQERGINDSDFYIKEGDTSYLLYPQFGSTNYAAWQAYYDGGCQGSTPDVDPDFMGDISPVLYALNHANDDPEVKNLVIDIALNPGGSLDLFMAMTALMSGQSHLNSENLLTGQKVTTYYDIDCNFDGVFDDQDKEVWKNFQLTYGVMTSDVSFSCGNQLPSLMKDMGFLIIGEKCGGGSCALQYFVTPEGLQYQLSSARCHLTDMNWQEIDAGVQPTIPIAYTLDDGVTLDYSKFYDIPYVSNLLKDATDIKTFDNSTIYNLQFNAGAWYTLDGRRLDGKPSAKGIYINNGRKIVRE